MRLEGAGAERRRAHHGFFFEPLGRPGLPLLKASTSLRFSTHLVRWILLVSLRAPKRKAALYLLALVSLAQAISNHNPLRVLIMLKSGLERTLKDKVRHFILRFASLKLRPFSKSLT